MKIQIQYTYRRKGNIYYTSPHVTESACGYATDERQKCPEWRAADKENRVGRGKRLVLAPGGSHVDPICTDLGASGTRITSERLGACEGGFSEATGHTEVADGCPN